MDLRASKQRNGRGIGWAVGRGKSLTKNLYLCLVAALFWLIPEPDGRLHAQSQPVDLKLVLAIDCSYSVDSREFALQVQGLALAFRDPEVISAIAEGPYGRIAVTVVQWSDARNQRVGVPWTIVSGEAEANQLSQEIAGLQRLLVDGGTSIAAMMRFGVGLLRTSPLSGLREVIDIAADGRNNNGGDPTIVREEVAALGITINGLAILNEVRTLDRYFERYIIAGPGSFVIVSNDYASYATAMKRKLLREIIGPAVS